MVVCKCRKATRLYCFVHKAPVCGQCICFPEHQICVVNKYSDWVVDGEYDWPPQCSHCHTVLEEGSDSQTTRLGCLHLTHTSCLVSHIQSFPPQTASADYVCPTCSSPIWPPKSIKDTGSRLYSKLKEAIIQSGLQKNVIGNHMVSMSTIESRAPPPAFSSDPPMPISGIVESPKSGTTTYDSVKDSSLSLSLIGSEKYPNEVYSTTVGRGSPKLSEGDSVQVDGPSPAGKQTLDFVNNTSPKGPGATTRKGAYHVDRQNSEMSYYADDEDGIHNKYTRRGSFRHKFLRFLLPFWSSALPTLPVTVPPRKEVAGDDAQEGRLRHQRSRRMDPRKILLTIAIMDIQGFMRTEKALRHSCSRRELLVDSYRTDVISSLKSSQFTIMLHS